MNKVIFYIPTIVFTTFFGLMSAIYGVSSISPIVIVWIVLFLISSFLLSKDKLWGGLLGILPGINLIYMSNQDTGQVVDIELPLGIVILLYYAICGYLIYKKGNAKSNS